MKRKSPLAPLRRFLVEEVRPWRRSRDRKPLPVQIAEMARLWRLHGYPPYQYVQSKLYERSFAGRLEDYLPARLIQTYRNDRNPPEHRTRAHDKQSFYRILASVPGVRAPATLRTDADGAALDLDGAPLTTEALHDFATRHGPRLFLKPVFGGLGRGARIENFSPDPVAALRRFPNHVVQEVIRQHPALATLHPSSVNTVRIDTFIDDDGRCVSNAAVLRMGFAGSIIDNWAAGGIAVAIDLETGRLRGRGRRKNLYLDDRRFDRHPDTGAVFEGFQVPFWPEALTAVRAGAEAFAPLRSLGWDVVITPEGPLLLEANVGWHVDIMQQIWGGLAPTPIGRAALAARASTTRATRAASALAG